ncbi:hypothetical protein SK128_011702 [Halocaridina rubra]|uniref:SPARC/Testican calcium-binding domain-containing protein n=1 Tax=Halocaridina rubra TaxID=373956 RepID=A0AAN8WIG8_HALRR
MKSWLILLSVLGALTLTNAGKESKVLKKAHNEEHKKHLAEIEEKLEHLRQMEQEIESEIAMAEEEELDLYSEDSDGNTDETDDLFDDDDVLAVEDEEEEEDPRAPCSEMYCGAGRQCIIRNDGEGECVCVSSCEEEVDPRRRVCSSLNETWMSDCELYRQRCLCEDEEAKCVREEYGHMHIDYYGECKEFENCKDSELADFPRRMSEWLFNIMRDMADRKTLSQHYLRLEQEAESNPSKQWTNAVVWKWCELDSHPRNRAVSRHELFPIRAPLLALEHCIGTFLDSCDPDDDHEITIHEWAKCTKLSVDDVSKLEDLCEDIRDA